MAKLQHPTSTRILQLRITLIDSDPTIWRRVLVADQITLYQLHQVIQIAMGWTNSHLHLFDIDDRLYSLPEFGLDDWGEPVSNERRTRLFAFDWRPKKTFRYDYDFGDNWRHEVVKDLSPASSDLVIIAPQWRKKSYQNLPKHWCAGLRPPRSSKPLWYQLVPFAFLAALRFIILLTPSGNLL